MEILHNIFIQSYSIYKGLFSWLSWSGFVSAVFLRPVLQVMMFAILGRFAAGTETARSLAIGVAMQSMAYLVVIGIAQTYSNEIRGGTLSFFYISKANRLLNFFCRPIAHFPTGLLNFTMGMLTAWFIVNINGQMVNWTGLIITTLIVLFSITAFGQFIGIFAIIFREWGNSGAAASGIVLALTGAIIPITVFPSALQEFCRILPTTNGLMAIRGAISGASSGVIFSDMWRELATGMVYYAIATIGFLLFEQVAKRRGMLANERYG